MIRYDYDIAALKQLSGADFDKQYLLRVAIAHNAMLRHVSNELNGEGTHPEMVTFAKAVLKTIDAQNSSIEPLRTVRLLCFLPGASDAAASKRWRSRFTSSASSATILRWRAASRSARCFSAASASTRPSSASAHCAIR